jgi:mycofactocin precursor
VSHSRPPTTTVTTDVPDSGGAVLSTNGGAKEDTMSHLKRAQAVEIPQDTSPVETDSLVEEVSIDGMCGVY